MSMGRPVERAGCGTGSNRYTNGLVPESFVYRFESGPARRISAPNDRTAALGLSATRRPPHLSGERSFSLMPL
jgi:hypothetical protein